jgi:hypothetical protein
MRGLTRTRQRKIFGASVVALVALVGGLIVGINAASGSNVTGLGPLDHYLCYGAQGQSSTAGTVAVKPFPKKPVAAWLQNQFGSVLGQVTTLKTHCNPVHKTVPGANPTAITRPDDHLVCFGFKPNINREPPIVNIRNQFSPADASGEATPVPLAVGPLQSLCLPSFKSNTVANLLPGVPTDLDHFACYAVKYPTGSTIKFVPPASVGLEDQFTDLLPAAPKINATVLVPQSLCLPTVKIVDPNPFTANPTFNDLLDKNDHLVCYAIRTTPAAFAPPTNPWFDRNQFGDGQVNILGAKQLCVPSLKDVPLPPPTNPPTTIPGETTTPPTQPCDPATGAQCVSPPVFSKSFSPSTITSSGTTSLVFVISNPNPTSNLTNISFLDNFPAGLVVASPNGLAGGCPGAIINAAPGANNVTMTGAMLTPLASCSFKVDVTATANTAPTLTNTAGPITATESGPGPTATATLTIG